MSWHEHINRGTLALAKENYDAAEQEFRSALTLTQNFSQCDERTRQTLGLLGQVRLRQCDYDQAASLLSQAVDTGRYSHRHNNLSHALNLISLATIKKDTGDGAGCNYRFQQALELLSQPPADFEFELTTAKAAVNSLFRSIENSESDVAQEKFQQLLNNAKVEPGVKSQSAKLRWRFLLAEAKGMLQRRNEAADVGAYKSARQAVDIAFKLFDRDHPDMALTLTSLALCSQRVRMLDQAEALYNRAVTIYSAEPATLSQLKNVKLTLAAFYAEVGDFVHALSTLVEVASTMDETDQSAARVYRAIMGMFQHSQLQAQAHEALRQAIKYEETENSNLGLLLYDRSATIMRRLFPSDHAELVDILRFKAGALRALRHDEAADCAEKEADAMDADLLAQARRFELIASNLQPFQLPLSRNLRVERSSRI